MYKKELKLLKSIVIKAYKKCIKNKKKDIIRKSNKAYNNDFVTSCDLSVEKYLIKKIKLNFPNDNIVSEEFNSNNKCKGRCWVLDPIDGTINFMRDLPMWCIQTAFVVDGDCKMSVIYCPTLNELYIANEKGLFINDKLVSINKEVEIKDSIVNISSLVQSYNEVYEMQNKLISVLGKDVLKINMFGSAGYEFACVASGKIQAYAIFNNNIWDIVPGRFICEKAGAKIVQKQIGLMNVTIACHSEELLNKIEKVL